MYIYNKYKILLHIDTSYSNMVCWLREVNCNIFHLFVYLLYYYSTVLCTCKGGFSTSTVCHLHRHLLVV